MYYSTFFYNVDVVIAAPQYYLYDYLFSERKFDNLEVIIGDDESECATKRLNMLLAQRISYSDILPKRVYIHYSTNEHTYKEHIEDLLADLGKNGVKLHEDIGCYYNHMDLKYHFPNYLVWALNDILKVDTNNKR